MVKPNEAAHAERRARDLLVATSLFDELGLGQFACDARAVARDVLELVVSLDAERSARIAIQERAERFEQLAARWATKAQRTAG